MKRYTFKIEDGSYHTRYLEGMSTRGLIEKLGKLEDLEETLGMDLEKLQETVEKATPKKRSWSIKNNGKTFDCCPVCKKTIKITYQYCPNCGQKLDWSE